MYSTTAYRWDGLHPRLFGRLRSVCTCRGRRRLVMGESPTLFTQSSYKIFSRPAPCSSRQQSERWEPPADHHNTTGQFDPAAHGFHGINSVSLNGYPASTLGAIVQKVTEELNSSFSFNLDTNSGYQLGIGEPPYRSIRSCIAYSASGWEQNTIHDGQRIYDGQ